jgi:hypothetical protein
MLQLSSFRARSRSRSIVACIVSIILAFASLPHDNPLWLALRFNIGRLRGYMHSFSTDGSQPDLSARFAVNTTEDVGIIIKTGYGTRHRLPGSLEALESGFDSRDILVVADFSSGNGSQLYYHGDHVPVHDTLAPFLEDHALKWMLSTSRIKNYLRLRTAISRGDSAVAQEIGKSVGWELDAMKVSPLPWSSA